MTTKEDAIKIRRGKVAALMSKGYSQAQISRELRCSEPTISRDVEELRRQAIRNVEDHVEGLPMAWETAKTSLEYLIFKTHEILENEGLEVDQRLAAIKIISDLSRSRLDLHSAPLIMKKAVEATQKLRQKIEQLQKGQASSWQFVTEIEKSAGQADRVTRRAVRKKPLVDTGPIV